MMKRFYYLFTLLVFFGFSACSTHSLVKASENIKSPLTGFFLEDDSYLPVAKEAFQIRRTPGFILGYSEPHEQAIWVVYHLTEIELQGTVRRTDDFRLDSDISSGSATLLDYRRSGFDRGHFAPAGDMKWSVSAMSHSFLLSNVSPQLGIFNRGIWLELEKGIRHYVRNIQGSVYIVMGPLFEGAIQKLGSNGVSVPSHYWKIVFDYSVNQMTGYLLPHDENGHRLKDYVVTVDALERATGLDFFSSLANPLEESLEAKLGNFTDQIPPF